MGRRRCCCCPTNLAFNTPADPSDVELSGTLADIIDATCDECGGLVRTFTPLTYGAGPGPYGEGWASEPFSLCDSAVTLLILLTCERSKSCVWMFLADSGSADLRMMWAKIVPGIQAATALDELELPIVAVVAGGPCDVDGSTGEATRATTLFVVNNNPLDDLSQEWTFGDWTGPVSDLPKPTGWDVARFNKIGDNLTYLLFQKKNAGSGESAIAYDASGVTASGSAPIDLTVYFYDGTSGTGRNLAVVDVV